MDNTRPTPTGSVYSTPEAGPLTPPTMRDHFTDPIPGFQPAAAAQAATTDTPEAEVIGAGASPTSSTSLSAREQDPPIRIGVNTSTSGSGKDQGGHPELEPEEIAKDIGDRLRPVVDAAEDVATKALDFSAKGLTKLVDMLEERRRHRDTTDPS